MHHVPTSGSPFIWMRVHPLGHVWKCLDQFLCNSLWLHLFPSVLVLSLPAPKPLTPPQAILFLKHMAAKRGAKGFSLQLLVFACAGRGYAKLCNKTETTIIFPSLLEQELFWRVLLEVSFDGASGQRSGGSLRPFSSD